MHRKNRLFPGSEHLPFVRLEPGELYMAWEPSIIFTLLGSCISVVIYLPESKVSAVCHSMLPNYGIGRPKEPFRYVDSTIHHIMDSFRQAGLSTYNMQVKLFGGANMFYRDGGAAVNNIGQRNILAARQVLAKYDLKLHSSKVGGRESYKLYVRSDTGEVMLQNLVDKCNP